MDIQKYLSGMLNYNPNIDWADQQKFDANGMPIPIGPHPFAGTDAEPKMMDSVHAANDIGQELKAAWLKGAKKFMGGSGMLNSKKDIGGRNKPVKRVQNLKTSEKPGWTMAEGTNFWTVNTDDPYWDTKEGYDEAIALYGESPAWSTMPVQPKQMLNNNRNTVAANLKKYF
jgi:hypothetical protein